MEREEGDRDLAINLTTATTTTTSHHGNDLPHTMSNGSVNGNGDGRDSPVSDVRSFHLFPFCGLFFLD